MLRVFRESGLEAMSSLKRHRGKSTEAGIPGTEWSGDARRGPGGQC